MLLILRSSAASSGLRLAAPFSEGTSAARGCRCPIGASIGAPEYGDVCGDVREFVELPVRALFCATATDPLSRIRKGMAVIKLAVINFRIALLPSFDKSFIVDIPEFRSFRNCAGPAPHNSGPCEGRPWWRAAKSLPHQHDEKSQQHRVFHIAAALLFRRLQVLCHPSSVKLSRLPRLELHLTAIVDDTITRFRMLFTSFRQRICLRQRIYLRRRIYR